MAENAYKLFECEVWENIRKETAAIEDRDEQRIREELMDDIMLAVGRYYTHIREWEYGQLIKKWHERGIVFEPCECAPHREKWDSTSRIPQEEPRQFRWEELWGRDNVLHDRGENTPAADAFDRAEKSTFAMFFDDCDEAYIIKGCENLTAADVEELRALSHLRKMDIYLMPADEKLGDGYQPQWSYVTSHEQDCCFGPFFVVG